MANEEKSEFLTISETSKFSDDLSFFYLNGTLSDIKLIVEDEEIFAHKIVLVCRSRFFQDLLLRNPKRVTYRQENTSPETVKEVLKYIYTGSFTCPSLENRIFDMLKLARKYLLDDLATTLTNQMKSIVNVINVCVILNTVNDQNMDDLRDFCHSFIINHLKEVQETQLLGALSQKSIVKLLKWDSLPISGIDTFNIAVQWCKANKDDENLVINCVKLETLTSTEILNVVWPSKLIESEKLIEVLAKIENKEPRDLDQTSFSKIEEQPKIRRVKDKNIATEENAKVISGHSIDNLFGRSAQKQCYQVLTNQKGIVVDLGHQSYFNHISMRLDDRGKSYYIDISNDETNWETIINYNLYDCRSVQNLYFKEQCARYIRVVGTKTSYKITLLLILSFEVFLKTTIPKVYKTIVCPNEEIVVSSWNFISSKKSNNCNIKNDTIIIQLDQPYRISNISVRTKYNCQYFVYVTSNRLMQWTGLRIGSERVNSWQLLQFPPIVVNYIKITSSSSTILNFDPLLDLKCNYEIDGEENEETANSIFRDFFNYVFNKH